MRANTHRGIVTRGNGGCERWCGSTRIGWLRFRGHTHDQIAVLALCAAVSPPSCV